MSNYDDRFPKRVGGMAGKDIERTVFDQIGQDGIDSFRTSIRNTEQGEVRVRTKGGNPEVIITPHPGKPVVKPYVPTALIEKDFSGGFTQNDRLYFNKVVSGKDGERRLFSPDGLYSICITPLMRIAILSQSSVGDIMLDVWLNDLTPCDPLKPKSSDGMVAVSASDNVDFSNKRAGIRLVERLFAGSAALGDEDVMEPSLARRYYKPEFIAPSTNAEFTPTMDTKFLGFLIRRIKRLVFNTSTCEGVTLGFDNYGQYTGLDVHGEGATGYVEDAMAERTYSPRLTGTKLSGIPLLLAEVGGVLEPMNVPVNNLLNLSPNTGSLAKKRPLTSLSDVVAFGQPWHGYLEGESHWVSNGDGTSSLVFDDITLWDSPAKTKRILSDENNVLAPALVEKLREPDVYNAFFHYDFGLQLPTDIDLGDTPAFLTTDIRMANGYNSPLKDSLPVVHHTTGNASVLYRDDNKTVWRIWIEMQKTAPGVVVHVRLERRIDGLFDPPVTIDRVLENKEFFTFAALTGHVTAEEALHLRVKNDPTGKSAAVMIVNKLDTSPTVVAYGILNFSGIGVTDITGDNGPFGDGIDGVFSTIGTPIVSGPLGKATGYEISAELFPFDQKAANVNEFVGFNYPLLNMNPIFFYYDYLGSKGATQTVTILNPQTQTGLDTREIWDATYYMNLVSTGVTKIGRIDTNMTTRLLDIYYDYTTHSFMPFRYTIETVTYATSEVVSTGPYSINASYTKEPVFDTTQGGVVYMSSWTLPQTSLVITPGPVIRRKLGYKTTYTVGNVLSFVDDHIGYQDITFYGSCTTGGAGQTDSAYQPTVDSGTGTVFPPTAEVTASFPYNTGAMPIMTAETTAFATPVFPNWNKNDPGGFGHSNSHPAFAVGKNPNDIHAADLYFDGVKGDTKLDMTYSSIIWTCDPKTRKPIILPPDTHAMIF